jgi:hypothetical protein
MDAFGRSMDDSLEGMCVDEPPSAHDEQGRAATAAMFAALAGECPHPPIPLAGVTWPSWRSHENPNPNRRVR